MKRITIVLLLLSFFHATLRANETEPMKALIVTGQCKHYHNWELSSQLLQSYLLGPGLFSVDVAVTPPRGGDMHRFRPEFESYRLVVVDYEGDNWSPEIISRFTNYVRNGGGVVFLHTGFAAINGSQEFDKIVGLRSYEFDGRGPHVYWQNGEPVKDGLAFKAGFHPPRHEFVLTMRNREHPICQGLPEKWKHIADDLYCHLRGPAQNLTILATAYSNPNQGPATSGKHEPQLYTVHYGKGRAFVCTLGHVGKDTQAGTTKDPACCTGFITVFQRGCEWAATGKVTQSVPADFPTAVKTCMHQPQCIK